MSRTLAKIKLQEARQALRCAYSNFEQAAEQLSGDAEPGVKLISAGLTLFNTVLDEMQTATLQAIADLEGGGRA